MTRYEQGFLNKCAEYGLDENQSAELMHKQAGLGGILGKGLGILGTLGARAYAATHHVPASEARNMVRLARGAGRALPKRLSSAFSAAKNIRNAGVNFTPNMADTFGRTANEVRQLGVGAPLFTKNLPHIGRANAALGILDTTFTNSLPGTRMFQNKLVSLYGR